MKNLLRQFFRENNFPSSFKVNNGELTRSVVCHSAFNLMQIRSLKRFKTMKTKSEIEHDWKDSHSKEKRKYRFCQTISFTLSSSNMKPHNVQLSVGIRNFLFLYCSNLDLLEKEQQLLLISAYKTFTYNNLPFYRTGRRWSEKWKTFFGWTPDDND